MAKVVHTIPHERQGSIYFSNVRLIKVTANNADLVFLDIRDPKQLEGFGYPKFVICLASKILDISNQIISKSSQRKNFEEIHLPNKQFYLSWPLNDGISGVV